MEKNPFSFYDFLGYLFPGMLTLLIVIHIIYLKDTPSICDYFSIAGFMDTVKNKLSFDWFTYSGAYPFTFRQLIRV